MSPLIIFRGFTLLELMVTLSILLILATASSFFYHEVKENIDADVAIHRLRSAMNYARSEAILRGQAVVLCPSNDNKTCHKDWSLGYMVFVDIEGNHRLSDRTALLRTYPGLQGHGQFIWRGFLSRDYIEWLPFGINHQQNGTMVYCSTEKNERYNRGIVVSRTGRTRFAGIDEQKIC